MSWLTKASLGGTNSQRQGARAPAAMAAMDYWKQRLLGKPPLLLLPTDRPRGSAAVGAPLYTVWRKPLPLQASDTVLRPVSIDLTYKQTRLLKKKTLGNLWHAVTQVGHSTMRGQAGHQVLI